MCQASHVLVWLTRLCAVCDGHLQEASKYCALVTVGSYCIVQDTKMSRWAAI